MSSYNFLLHRFLFLSICLSLSSPATFSTFWCHLVGLMVRPEHGGLLCWAWGTAQGTRRCCHPPYRPISNNYLGFWIFWQQSERWPIWGLAEGYAKRSLLFLSPPWPMIQWQSLGHPGRSVQPRTHAALSSESR